MRTMPRMLTGGVFLAVIVGATASVLWSEAQRDIHPAVPQAEWERWKTEYSNWGRWGKDDQLGTLNLITPAKKIQAAALVKEGISVSIAHAVLTDADATEAGYVITRESLGSEHLSYAPHGASKTHMDALAHIFSADFDGKGYNNFTPASVAELKKAGGHPRLTHLAIRHGIFTRAVLMDIARLKRAPWLEPDTPVMVEDLEAWEKEVGVKVTAGDALLVRTGRWARWAKVGPWDFLRSGERSGLDQSVVPWLRERDIAVLGTDISNVPGAAHDFSLIMLGMPMLDAIDLEAAADTAAKLKRWEFLLTVAPLALNTTGSAINPIVVF